MSKKIIAVLLAIIVGLVGVIVGITIEKDDTQTTGNNTATSAPEINKDEWVLVSEKDIDEFGELKRTVNYNYDIDGHITSSVITFADGDTQTISNYVYDDAGNLVSKKLESDVSFEGITSMDYFYEYDENGNCIKETIEYGKYKTVYEYTLDTYGNKIKEVELYYYTSEPFVEPTTYELTYENGKLVRSKNYIYKAVDNSYVVEEYEYNDEGLLSSTKIYVGGDTSEYELSKTTHFTYAKLSDVI